MAALRGCPKASPPTTRFAFVGSEGGRRPRCSFAFLLAEGCRTSASRIGFLIDKEFAYDGQMAGFRSKKHRLPAAAYRGQKNVAFTANVEDRRRLFDDSAVVGAMLPTLRDETERFGCLVGIYCFMP